MYYIFLENEKLNGAGQCKCLNCENIEVEQDIYEDYIKNPNKYTWGEKKVEVEVPNFETVTKTVQVQVGTDEDNNPIFEAKEVEEKIQSGIHTENQTVKVIILNTDYEKDEEEKKKQEEIIALKQELDELDLKTVRPLRAINNGTATDYDVEKLNVLEQQAKEIRERIAELSNAD